MNTPDRAYKLKALRSVAGRCSARINAAADNTDQKISGVSVVINVFSQLMGASQNKATAQTARVLSAPFKAHHSAAPIPNGSSTTGSRIDHMLSPSVARITAIHQPE